MTSCQSSGFSSWLSWFSALCLWAEITLRLHFLICEMGITPTLAALGALQIWMETFRNTKAKHFHFVDNAITWSA